MREILMEFPERGMTIMAERFDPELFWCEREQSLLTSSEEVNPDWHQVTTPCRHPLQRHSKGKNQKHKLIYGSSLWTKPYKYILIHYASFAAFFHTCIYSFTIDYIALQNLWLHEGFFPKEDIVFPKVVVSFFQRHGWSFLYAYTFFQGRYASVLKGFA